MAALCVVGAGVGRHSRALPVDGVAPHGQTTLSRTTGTPVRADDQEIAQRASASASGPSQAPNASAVAVGLREAQRIAPDASDLSATKLAADLLAVPEDKISILDAALSISRVLWPPTDITTARHEIEKIAERIEWWVRAKGGTTDPDQRVRIINTVLYREFGYRYDLSDRLARKLESQVLGATIATRTGTCATLPLLYYVVAERMGYPIRAVWAPQHLFLRYEDGTYHSNIDAGAEGSEYSDEEYVRKIGIPPEGIRSGAYMRSLTKRQLLANLIVGMGSTLRGQGRLREAELIYEMALAVDPKIDEAHIGLALLAAARSNAHGMGVAGTHNQYWETAMVHAQRAMELGAPPPLSDHYWDEPPPTNPRPFDLVSYLRRQKGVTP